jgi:hypothetical protein
MLLMEVGWDGVEVTHAHRLMNVMVINALEVIVNVLSAKIKMPKSLFQ